jgi:WS/DGAT/MGAT family acyltransferase
MPKRDFSRRLNEADAMFLRVEEAAGIPYAPVGVGIMAASYNSVAPGAADHMREVQARLLPAMRRRIVKDRFSLALPRWVDVEDYDLSKQSKPMPVPGDGSLRAILDFAAEFGRQPMPTDRAPWRSVYFEDVTIDGREGCMVTVGQQHHAVIDGQGGRKMGEQILQFSPDASLPEMPPPVPPDDSTAWSRWVEGWALEGHKAKQLVKNNAARARWAARNPKDGVRRARELAQALGRIRKNQGTTPFSTVIDRRSDRVRFDVLPVDIAALKAGTKAAGASVNDGFMGALSVALHRYHLDHGGPVDRLRTAMAISTRTDADGHTGNKVIAATLELPLHDEITTAIKACAEVSRRHREDTDVLWLIDRLRAMANRMPRRLVVNATKKATAGFDVQVSNVHGIPVRYWIAGVESLRGFTFPTAGPGVAIIMSSSRGKANLAMSTCPVAIQDPEHLLDRIREALDEVYALAHP